MCGRLMPTTLRPSAGSVFICVHSSAPPAPALYWIDGVDRRALLLQHQLLVARRQVRFAAGRERLPVHEIGCRARRRLRQCRRREGDAEHGCDQDPDHGVSFGCDLFYLRTVNGPGETMAAASRDDRRRPSRTTRRSPYLERVREYYQALGYGAPYEWAHFDDVPFAPPRRAARGVPRRAGDDGRAVPPRRATRARARRTTRGAKFYRVYSGDTGRDDHDLRISHLAIDRQHTTRRRPGDLVPARGAAPRRGGRPDRRGRAALPRRADQPQPARDAGRDGAEIVARCRADGVDAAILVANCPVCHQTLALIARAARSERHRHAS